MEEMLTSVFRRMEPEDFRVLTAVELGMVSHEYTPIEDVIRYSSLPEEEVAYRLGRLNGFKLLRVISKPFRGYALNYYGYDFLALNVLVKAGKLEALGKPLGIGKEADVWDGLAPGGVRVVVKFHRVGRISFRQTRRARRYIADRRHVSWLYQSRIAAEREYEALKILDKINAKSPKPIAQNRHVLIMEYFNGIELAEVAYIDEPKLVLKDILDELRKIYLEAGIIHGDLSEYNVVIKEDGDFLLIDWPQFMRRDESGCEFYLRRDLRNIVKFFVRRFGLRINGLHGILSYVIGASDSVKFNRG